MTIAANFAIDTHTVTFAAGPNGGIAGDTEQTINHRADCTSVTATADTGYHFVNWTDDADSEVVGASATLTLANVTADMAVTANFSNAWTVTFNQGAHGTITGSSVQTVEQGGNCSAVSAIPNTGYDLNP